MPTPSQVVASQIKDKTTIFSWKYYENRNTKFSVSEQNAAYFGSLLERLKTFSSKTPLEIKTDKSKGARSNHAIDFNDSRATEKNFGITNEDKIVEEPFQLSVSKSHGRIHGFFIDNIFCIVWLDPNHALCPWQTTN